MHAQEVEKKVQKEFDQKVKVNQMAGIKQRLTEELDVTPHTPIKQRLWCTSLYTLLPLNNRMEDIITDELSNNKFQPTLGYEHKTEVKIETKTDCPPKMKKMQRSQCMQLSKLLSLPSALL